MNPLHTITVDANSTLQDTWVLMPNWKWIALAAALFLGFFLIQALRFFLQGFKKRFEGRFAEESWAHFSLKQEIHRPLSLILVATFWMIAWNAIAPVEPLSKILLGITQILLSLGLLQLAYMAVDALGDVLQAYVRKTSNALDDQLAPFATKAMKVLVVILGILITLQNFGVNVVSLLAGLGIGGVALAFAAQDTVANVFGSIMIILDRPFHIGDWIKVADTEGIVEEIGFRSTRIRTFYKSLITIPNSVMAKEKIDNYSLRPSRRFRHIVGLAYDARPEQIQNFVNDVRSMLTQHPNVNSSDITVSLLTLGDSALQVQVVCFLVLQNPDDEPKIQQELLLGIIRITEANKLNLAFPSQTLYHVLPPDPQPQRTQAPAPPAI